MCDQGMYSTLRGAVTSASCLACPPGTYSAAGSDACNECPTGTFSTSAGMWYCSLCSIGTYSVTYLASSDTCLQCIPGSSSNTVGQTVCALCAAATVSSGQGETAWISCESGTFSLLERGSTACCGSCEAGTYADAYGGYCVGCGAGKHWTGQGAMSSVSCSPCGPNIYSEQSTGSTSCLLACGPATYAVPGFCAGCYAGTYWTGTGATSSVSRSLCGAGMFSSGTGQTVCSLCQAGTYSSALGASTQELCASCGSVSYSTALGASFPPACIACAAAQFVPLNWPSSMSSCSLCAAATYLNSSSHTSCGLCPAGTFSTMAGATSSRRAQPARQVPFRIRGRVIARDVQQEHYNIPANKFADLLQPVCSRDLFKPWKLGQQPVQRAPWAKFLIRGRFIARDVQQGHTYLQIRRPTAACVQQGPIQQLLVAQAAQRALQAPLLMRAEVSCAEFKLLHSMFSRFVFQCSVAQLVQLVCRRDVLVADWLL